MDGGAWNSEVFDNGRDFQKTRAPVQTASGLESGSAPGMYNPSPSLVGKDSRLFGVLTVTLRIALVLFSLIGLCVMAAMKQNLYGYSSYLGSSIDVFKFKDVMAFVGLLTLDIIVCLYSIVQLVLCVVQVSKTGTFISSAAAGGSLLTFIFDSVLAYALIAAAAAAASAQAYLQSDGYCSRMPAFCRKAQASIAMSFFAFAFLASCAALYPIRLLRMSK